MPLIRIAQKLCPFSHEPGARCFIPGTSYLVEAFPALVRICEFSGNVLKEFPIPMPISMHEPMKEFTVMQNLERGCVTVFSKHYGIHVLPNLDIVDSKHPHLPPLIHQECLSLGSHKQLDVDLIRRKRDLLTLFPIWFKLGALLKLPARSGDDRGMFSLLAECRAARDSHHPETIISTFEKLMLAGFEAFLVPRAKDAQMQGILPLGTPINDDSPLYLLTESAALIRALFILTEDKEISLLPNCPPEFFAGRMTGVVASYGTLDLEWSKKTIRQLHFRAHTDGELLMRFPTQMVSCRLRMHPNDKGRLFTCGDSLAIKSGSLYLWDRFQK